MFVIKKASRHSPQATLHITGRDVEQDEILIRLSENTCQWEFVGDADELTKQEVNFEYQTSPVVKTIRALLEESPKKQWTGFAKNLLQAGERLFQIPISPSSQSLGKELTIIKDLLLTQDKIVYRISPNGNAGHWHHFYYAVEDEINDNIQEEDGESVEF